MGFHRPSSNKRVRPGLWSKGFWERYDDEDDDDDDDNDVGDGNADDDNIGGDHDEALKECAQSGHYPGLWGKVFFLLERYDDDTEVILDHQKCSLCLELVKKTHK